MSLTENFCLECTFEFIRPIVLGLGGYMGHLRTRRREIDSHHQKKADMEETKLLTSILILIQFNCVREILVDSQKIATIF